MKTKKILIALVMSLSALSAQAEEIIATPETGVPAEWVEGVARIPQIGDLSGNAVSVYGGSAWGLSYYLVTVGNTAAECEGDDCLASKTFHIGGNFRGPVKAVYSRKVDKQTYSIALMTTYVEIDDEGSAKYFKAKILLRVKFTSEGVSEVADMQIVKLK